MMDSRQRQLRANFFFLKTHGKIIFVHKTYKERTLVLLAFICQNIFVNFPTYKLPSLSLGFIFLNLSLLSLLLCDLTLFCLDKDEERMTSDLAERREQLQYEKELTVLADSFRLNDH